MTGTAKIGPCDRGSAKIGPCDRATAKIGPCDRGSAKIDPLVTERSRNLGAAVNSVMR